MIPDSLPSSSRIRPITLMLVLLLAIAGLIALLRSPSESEQTVIAESRALPPHASIPAVAGSEALDDADDWPPAEPSIITVKGQLRLQAGETAVISYWEIEPGVNGVMLVDAERTADGVMAYGIRAMEVPDQVAESSMVQELLPDIFGNEHCEAIGPERLDALLGTVRANDETRETGYPRLVTQADSPVTFRSLIQPPDGSSWLGTSFTLRAKDAGGAPGAFDLEFDLERRGRPDEAE